MYLQRTASRTHTPTRKSPTDGHLGFNCKRQISYLLHLSLRISVLTSTRRLGFPLPRVLACISSPVQTLQSFQWTIALPPPGAKSGAKLRTLCNTKQIFRQLFFKYFFVWKFFASIHASLHHQTVPFPRKHLLAVRLELYPEFYRLVHFVVSIKLCIFAPV